MLNDAVEFLRGNDDFLLISHISPDADTLGSALALYAALRGLGKRAEVVCADPVPQMSRFLPNADIIRLPEEVRSHDCVVTIDCADRQRTGRCESLFLKAGRTLNIDHHGTNDLYAQANYVERAGATGELIYRIVTALGAKLTTEVASCLYAALTTDTGNFSYTNTTPDTFRTAAALLESGIDLPYLNRMLFRTVPYRKMKLHAFALMKMKLYDEGRIGITTLSHEDMASCGASGEDAEGVIDAIRDIDTVEIAVTLREDADDSIRCSLRGKTYANVSAIATRFGGGGHRFAAGCTLHIPLEKAAEAILREAEAALNTEE